MDKNLVVSVFEIVGNPLCVASGDGMKVYDRLAAALQQGYSVQLSFLNVTTLTSAFLNAAIGQLYGAFKEEKIRSLLTVEDMQQDDLALLQQVVGTAKQYFKDPKKFNQIIDEEQGENNSD